MPSEITLRETVMESILTSYSSAWNVIRLAFNHPTEFYGKVVREIDLKALIIFYFQFQAALIFISVQMFGEPGDSGAELFFTQSLIVTVQGVALSVLVISSIMAVALYFLQVRVRFAQLAKYIAVTFIVGHILLGSLQLFIEYYVYVQSDGYAWMDDWRNEEPWYSRLSNMIVNDILTPLVFVVSGILLAISSGNVWKVGSTFALAVLVQVLVLVPISNHFWLKFIQI